MSLEYTVHFKDERPPEIFLADESWVTEGDATVFYVTSAGGIRQRQAIATAEIRRIDRGTRSAFGVPPRI